MTNTLLDISGKIEPRIVNVMGTVCAVLAEFKIPYVVVGAYARDCVLHYGYGAKIQRATDDIDFAIEVPNWNAFNQLKEQLCDKDFSATKQAHRLISKNKAVIDIIPFGGIEDADANIAWPPKGDVVMKMLGFKEACEHAEWIKIKAKPEIKIPVATPQGMSLLKLIAWMDRTRDKRNKDAKDLSYLLTSYELIPEVKTFLFNEKKIMEKRDWDLTQAASYLLGQRARDIANENTIVMISALVKGKLKHHSVSLLADEMCVHIDSEFEKKQNILSAYMAGFCEE